ncbi:DnaJ domain-containing protein [Microbacterium sp. M28]|uniref:DnaJ domain-containing protein n=1 Tax=Microbacterium sp. M28 TaxID=2962064 RepID=UPI0021F3E3FE|nr:DnaJ domain-containing protein [Microbacterium sp. M28]UYO97078.1 DnaJ domain-containing protein [Microbacterium sp. M28]
MFDSPLSASAYEVLGVAPDVDEDTLRRAYRLRLRETHPDTGGDAAAFIQVQHAWELIGTAEARLAYERGHDDGERLQWGGRTDATRSGTRPRTASYGRAGSWRRERYLALVREWTGQEVADPYSPAFVRTATWELRRLLADALAEEDTARTMDDLGIGFTVWHDVVAGPGDETLDHVVLSPTGLYGLVSEDFGGPVGFRREEITGPEAGDRMPVGELLARMRAVSRAARVRFGGAIVVLPDGDVVQPLTPLGIVGKLPVIAVRRSALRTVLRAGVPGARIVGGNELFDVRTRLKQAIRTR